MCPVPPKQALPIVTEIRRDEENVCGCQQQQQEDLEQQQQELEQENQELEHENQVKEDADED